MAACAMRIRESSYHRLFALLKDMSSALILWISCNKTSIQDIKSIPEESRYPGSICHVKWSDKQHYLAKVLKISNNMNDLEHEEDAFHIQLDQELAILPPKRKKITKKNLAPAATEFEVAQAIGLKKCPLNNGQKAAKNKETLSKKASNKSKKTAENLLDVEIVKRQIFPSSDKTSSSSSAAPVLSGEAPTFRSHVQESSIVHQHTDESADEGMSDNSVDMKLGTESSRSSAWATKHDNNNVRAFLRDLCGQLGMECIIGEQTSKGTRYLDVLPVPEGHSPVELTRGSAVLISSRVKDAIKVDFHNSPSSMVRELIRALYGKDIFNQEAVTMHGEQSSTLLV